MDKVWLFLKKHRLPMVKALMVLFFGILMFGVYQAASYSWPMYKQDYAKAYYSLVGDKPTVLYDASLAAYQAGEFKLAKDMLIKAYSQCLDSSGHIPESKRQFAAKIQFLLGNVLVKMQMVKPAIEAYKESLRLEPNDLYAKYNLELLRSKNNGNASGDPNNPSGGGSNGGKKGI